MKKEISLLENLTNKKVVLKESVDFKLGDKVEKTNELMYVLRTNANQFVTAQRMYLLLTNKTFTVGKVPAGNEIYITELDRDYHKSYFQLIEH